MNSVGGKWCCVINLLSIFLLAITTIPGIFIYQTNFIDLNDLSIGNSQGVNEIRWGLWKACWYDISGKSSCTKNTWVTNPYTFDIVRNGNQAHAIVQQSWLRVLFTQPVVLLSTFVILIFVMMFAVWKEFDFDPTPDDKAVNIIRKDYYLVNVLVLIPLLFGEALTFLAEVFVLFAIKNEMQTLSTGGTEATETVFASGFIVAAFAGVLLFISTGYVFVRNFIRMRTAEKAIKKEQKVDDRKAGIDRMRRLLGQGGLVNVDQYGNVDPKYVGNSLHKLL